MNKGLVKNVIIILLATITAFCIYKYASSLKEKYALLDTLNRISEHAALLENEKHKLVLNLEQEKELRQKLAERNSGFKDYLKAGSRRLAKLFSDFREAQEAAEELKSRSAILKAENTALREEKERISVENEEMKTKLSSPVELKKALKQFKKQAHELAAAAQIEVKEQVEPEKITKGNRGYLTRGGASTFSSKIKIEVIPAQTKQ